MMLDSVSVHLHGTPFGYEQAHPARSAGCTLDHLHPSFKGVLAFCPEKVNVGLKLQFEDVLLVNTVWLFGGADRVAKQGEASQREVVLVSLVEEQAEVGENNPEFLPAITVLELPEEVTWELVLHRGKGQNV